MLKTQIFEKKGKLSSEQKILANFLAHSRVWQTSVNTLYGLTKYFDKYSGSLRINSVTSKCCWKHKFLKKKGKLSSEEKILPKFLAHSRVWQTSVNTLYGSTKFFDNYCGSYRINSVTPKKLLETQCFEKKGKFSSEEKIWAKFLAHSRVWQTSVNTLYGSTKFFDNYCGSYRINSVTPKELLKTQIFEKKGKLSSEEKIWAKFLAHSRVWQTSVNTLYGSTKFFDNYCGSYRINSVTPKKLLETQCFEKKRQIFQWRKDLGQIFGAFSSVTNLS